MEESIEEYDRVAQAVEKKQQEPHVGVVLNMNEPNVGPHYHFVKKEGGTEPTDFNPSHYMNSCGYIVLCCIVKAMMEKENIDTIEIPSDNIVFSLNGNDETIQSNNGLISITREHLEKAITLIGSSQEQHALIDSNKTLAREIIEKLLTPMLVELNNNQAVKDLGYQDKKWHAEDQSFINQAPSSSITKEDQSSIYQAPSSSITTEDKSSTNQAPSPFKTIVYQAAIIFFHYIVHPLLLAIANIWDFFVQCWEEAKAPEQASDTPNENYRQKKPADNSLVVHSPESSKGLKKDKDTASSTASSSSSGRVTPESTSRPSTPGSSGTDDGEAPLARAPS